MIILIHWRGRESRPHSAIATTHPLRFSGGGGDPRLSSPTNTKASFSNPFRWLRASQASLNNPSEGWGLPSIFQQPLSDGFGPSPRQGPFNQPFRCNSVFWFWPAPAELWCRKVWLKGKLGPKHSVQRTLPHAYFSNSFYKSVVFIEENGSAKSLEETGFKDTPDRGSAN